VKAIKSDIDSDSDEQKRSQGTPQNWRRQKRVTPPGVTHPSDATEVYQIQSNNAM